MANLVEFDFSTILVKNRFEPQIKRKTVKISSLFNILRLANRHHITLFDTIFKEDQFHHPNITNLHFHVSTEPIEPEFVWEDFINSGIMLEAFTGEDSAIFGPLLTKYPKEVINYNIFQKLLNDFFS